MTLKQFLDNHSLINGPSYRGEPQPDFDPNLINESKIADELRHKEVTTVWSQEDTLTIFWTTQEYLDDVSSLTKEIQRWLVNATTNMNLDYSSVFISLVIETRDHDDLGTYLIEEDCITYINDDFDTPDED